MSNLDVKRLDYNAETKEQVYQYYKTRALQLAQYGYRWSRSLDPISGGYATQLTRNGQKYDSFYIVASDRGQGRAIRAASMMKYPIITIDDCHIVDFLTSIGANAHIVAGIHDSVEYKLIEQVYGTDRAKRSKVYFMNHIDEGLFILSRLGASDATKKAWCLHPLLQLDCDLSKHFQIVVDKCEPLAVAYALEYRNIANQYQSDRDVNDVGDIIVSPLAQVNQMLVADKIQNYKDFIIYHKGTHHRSNELDVYFNNWLSCLGINNFRQWVDELSSI